MEGLNIGFDLLVVLVTAIAGGLLARWLKLPIILGYLVGGIAIGPFGFGLVHEVETIDVLANVGIILLLFTIGLEFSLKEVLQMGKVALLGGVAQILLTAAVGFGLGRVVGLSTLGMVFFGLIIALSSTMVVLKVLMERGELDTTYGRIMIGILLVQDLSVVPMMVIMPALAGGDGGIWTALGLAALKAVLFIGVMLVLGFWGLPWFLSKVAGQRSRELFLLTVVTLCLAAAFGTYFFGLSAAFGAFVAGLLVSQSRFARQAFADIMPLRDTFGALFFVSLGMLVNLGFVGDNASTVILVVIAVMVAKFIICSLITWIFGYSAKTVLFVGMGLMQIGEFSFIIAMMGVDSGILSEYLYSLTIAVAIISMLLTPFSLSLASVIYRRLNQSGTGARLFARRIDPEWQRQRWELSRHAIICGYGDTGRRLAKILDRQKFTYLVIELDPQVITSLHAQGVPCIYGDASNPEILAHAQLDKARVMVCTMPDFISEELAVRNALKIAPKLDIVARVRRDTDAQILKGIGVSELVMPMFEGSLEIIRHTLHRYGMSSTEIQYILVGLREGKITGEDE